MAKSGKERNDSTIYRGAKMVIGSSMVEKGLLQAFSMHE
jgi:hypothetical protein